MIVAQNLSLIAFVEQGTFRDVLDNKSDAAVHLRRVYLPVPLWDGTGAGMVDKLFGAGRWQALYHFGPVRPGDALWAG